MKQDLATKSSYYKGLEHHKRILQYEWDDTIAKLKNKLAKEKIDFDANTVRISATVILCAHTMCYSSLDEIF